MDREFTEQAVFDRLKVRAPHKFQIASIGQYFGVSYAEVHSLLKNLAAEGKILSVVTCGHRLFYYSAEEVVMPAAPKTYKVNAYVMSDALKAARVRCGELFELPSKGGD